MVNCGGLLMNLVAIAVINLWVPFAVRLVFGRYYRSASQLRSSVGLLHTYRMTISSARKRAPETMAAMESSVRC